jgi:cytochrome c oxidase assembly protein subunit 11
MPKPSPKNNGSLVFSLVAIVVGMVMLSYAAVPLYSLFCQITGFGGTTMTADSADLPEVVSDREVTVRFNADVFEGLPWKFEALQNKVKVNIGENKLIFFRATNLSDKATVGTSTYNVTPHKVGEYFAKIQCFCFEEQWLEPGESMEMPVSFYVDPDLLNDEYAEEVGTITLSYTFFPVKNPKTRIPKSES